MSSTTPLLKLAVLDDYQGISHSHFESLKSQFEITFIPDTLPAFAHPLTTTSQQHELITRLKPYTIISSMRERTPFPATLLSHLPNLKLLLTTGMRNAAIDLPAAKAHGIIVTGTKNARDTPHRRRADSTTQHTIAMILGIVRNLAADDHAVQDGLWQTSVVTSLAGKTLATVGLGRLGGTTAKIMWESFGMRVVCWSASLTQEGADRKAGELGLPVEDEDGGKTFEVVSKEELFRRADVLSVHYVLSERSRGIVGREDLALLKRSAFLVNTSRGPLVDEEALLDVLEKGAIQGAAVDVFEIEPLPVDSRWRSKEWGKNGRSKVLLTPHMGYVEEETISPWYAEQVQILQKWVKGEELPNVLT